MGKKEGHRERGKVKGVVKEVKEATVEERKMRYTL